MTVIPPRETLAAGAIEAIDFLKYGTWCHRIELGADLRIFKSRWFQRFARKEGIADEILCEAVARAQVGQIDADLGGYVIKQRIARPGQGRSKGYRTIILFRRGAMAFFVFGFAKSHLGNINSDEQKQFREAAKQVLALTEKQLATLLLKGDFVEVKDT